MEGVLDAAAVPPFNWLVIYLFFFNWLINIMAESIKNVADWVLPCQERKKKILSFLVRTLAQVSLMNIIVHLTIFFTGAVGAEARPSFHWINPINNWLIIQAWKWGFYVTAATALNVCASCGLKGGLPESAVSWVSRTNVEVGGVSQPLMILTPVWQQVGEAREQKMRVGPGSSFS